MPQASILKKTEPITDSFFIKADVKGLKLIAVKCNEVLFMEAYENYVLLHLSDGRKFVCHNTMKEMEESLPSAFFIRVHKSFIINYDKVSCIEGNIIVLGQNENHKIQIGKIYRKAFFERRSVRMIKKQKGQLFESSIYSQIASVALVMATALI
jgi:DNA-binding LytR/AlgR family response regulator